MKWDISFFVIFLIGVLTVASGCVSVSEIKNKQVHTQDVLGHQFEEMKDPVPEEGSLWTEVRGSTLFRDRRACQVGDLVTIRISESPTGELSASTETSRDSSISAGIPNFLGIMETYGQKNSLDPSNMFSANFSPEFKGDGKNERSGAMDAYVTARVTEVLANGNLRILGRQDIMVNNEIQHISITGIIRPEDISTSNQVQSSYVADARILYSGTGNIADKQQPGWMMRALDRIWPF
jgi:flagellar L-ring protein precursor FlgH